MNHATAGGTGFYPVPLIQRQPGFGRDLISPILLPRHCCVTRLAGIALPSLLGRDGKSQGRQRHCSRAQEGFF